MGITTNTTNIGAGQNFQIGSILVDPSRNLIKQGDEITPLEPRVMDVLEYLALHQGDVCSRDDIIATIWKVEFGADESLTRTISMIRKAFRKAGGRGKYIQTISKRGYSLQVPVTAVGEADREGLSLTFADFLDVEVLPQVLAPATAATIPSPIQTRVKPAPIIPNPAYVSPKETSQSNTASALVPSPKPRFLKPTLVLGGVIVLALIGQTVWTTYAKKTTFGQSVEINQYGRSVAVMPFSDMTALKDNQYFSDGLAVEISNEIGKIPSLQVVVQSTDVANRNKTLSYKDMGTELAVSHIIHGAVRKQDDRVRITAQLINTSDNQRAWSANYDGTFKDVFELQQRVSQDIATELTLLLDLDIKEVIDLENIPLSSFTSGKK